MMWRRRSEGWFSSDCPRFSGGRYKTAELPEARAVPFPFYYTPQWYKMATHERMMINFPDDEISEILLWKSFAPMNLAKGCFI